ILNYDTTNSSSSNQSDEEKTSADQDIKTSNQSDEEKTSTDQDEDIKVISQNSDEENTSSEVDNIDISDHMDTEPTDPYEKRKIESNIQTDDYLISFNIYFEEVQNTTSILTRKIENLTINKLNPENIGKSFSKNLLGYKTLRPNAHHRHKK
ncbi:hypothetical protein Gotur_024971, partial [Gossypium turneri]